MKRRMGLGVTGLANTIEAIGHPYGSEEFLGMQRTILGLLRNTAYKASALLAKERGRFPVFQRDDYLAGNFVKQLPPDVRDLIAEHGMRNSHLLSIAPTGTISMCADNVSSGIEPVFAYEAIRRIETPDGPEEFLVKDFGAEFLGVRGKVASEVTAQEHLAVLATAYPYVDSAVSKTCNVPSSMDWDEFKNIYMAAWKAGCKGCTTYREGGKRGAVIERVDESKSLCRLDPTTGRKECE